MKKKHCVSVTDSLFITAILCLSQTVFVCHIKSLSVTDSLNMSQIVCVCHIGKCLSPEPQKKNNVLNQNFSNAKCPTESILKKMPQKK